MTLAFVTNNASRTPEVIAEHLTSLGLTALPDEVVTSSMAVSRLLLDTIPSGSRVLVVGAEGLRRAVTDAGFEPVRSADDGPAAVVQGYGADVGWRELAEAVVAVRNDVPWIASNVDATLPSPRGPLPGNGALVEVVALTTGRRPLVAGKPEPPLHQEAVLRSGARHPLVVGDRLDTDIAGAVRVGAESLLVLTGVTDEKALLSAGPAARPTYVAHDVAGLLVPHPAVDFVDGRARVQRTAGADDGLDALRERCVTAWVERDAVH
jgi:HAD superfamily hydrolase (TIGR01450 family)